MVLDSVNALRDLADERSLRLAFCDLVSRVAHTDTVLVLAGEYWAPQTESFVEFALADGIVQLEYEAREPVDRRWGAEDARPSAPEREARPRGGTPR